MAAARFATAGECTSPAPAQLRPAPARCVTLTALAAELRIRPELLRRVIETCEDFPLERAGGRGQPFAFDRAAAVAWWRTHRKRALAAAGHVGRDPRVSLRVAQRLADYYASASDRARAIGLPRGRLGPEYFT